MSAIVVNSPLPVHYGERLALGYALSDEHADCTAELSIHVTVEAIPGVTVTDQPGGGTVYDATKRVSVGSARQRTAFTLSGGSEWSGGGGEALVRLLCRGTEIDSLALIVQP